MISTLAIFNYRSLRDFIIALDALNVITGPNGSGKSNVYRALRLLRPLEASELSDGTLRYLLWVAALLTPRPPPLLVLNEPETSLHPDLLPALGRLIAKASERSQVIVVTHSPALVAAMEEARDCRSIRLEKKLGETSIEGANPLQRPRWKWPAR
jgi:predicted ATPase